jgi:hypothetical protein
MTSDQATAGYWAIDEQGNFEYRDPDTDELLDVVPFAKARSLAAFFLWQVVESFGIEVDGPA